MSVTVPITHISRCSLHDGPGVRTVVYVKGCGLRCRWCHNPETLSTAKQVMYVPTKCIHCGRCVEECPTGHVIQGDDMVLVRDRCTACGRCTQVCPSGALTLCGKDMTAAEVFDEVRKDAHYYQASGGGVTVSGGECLLYPAFVVELLRLCREQGIHTAIETALFVPWESVEQVRPYVDLFFADLKIADPRKHKEYTGQDNARIVENLQRLSQVAERMIVRIPVIPDVNDTAEDIEGFAAILRSCGDRIEKVEMLKYNSLAESKYALIGADYHGFAQDPQTDAQMQALCTALAQASGLPCTFELTEKKPASH